ncbi:hypothetical protein LCGC14_2950950 [marine sediment metagenome]|uniref:RND efflux pump membrane fusion protein barrel-sandwich domain-containing protein n=1 Tax=marine sediment metagenome TaxID=412755 RepID=A0A0F9A6F9_9ZZZZ
MRLLNFMGFIPLLSVMPLFMVSCNGSNDTPPPSVKAAVDVRAAIVEVTNIKEYREYNGVTQYQKKESLRSNITGYIAYLPYERGDEVRRGATFATVRTKEQSALADAVSVDSSLAQFAKPLRIISNGSGIITKLNVIKGGYVAEGDILAVIAQPKTLVVKVNVPFDQKNGNSEAEILKKLDDTSKRVNTILAYFCGALLFGGGLRFRHLSHFYWAISCST